MRNMEWTLDRVIDVAGRFKRQRNELQRTIDRVRALCDQADTNPFGQKLIAVVALRAALGDGPGE